MAVTASIKIKVKLDSIENFKALVNDQLAEEVGAVIVNDSLNAIARGLSPVEGVGRFEAYKAVGQVQQASKIAKRLTGSRKETAKAKIRNLKGGYPYSVMDEYPDKKVRPVNLYLTGKMLSYFNFYRNGNSIWVGIINAPQKVKTIARVHNTGERSDIARRQFIPGDGQRFIASIMTKVRQLFRNRALEIIELSKK